MLWCEGMKGSCPISLLGDTRLTNHWSPQTKMVPGSLGADISSYWLGISDCLPIHLFPMNDCTACIIVKLYGSCASKTVLTCDVIVGMSHRESVSRTPAILSKTSHWQDFWTDLCTRTRSRGSQVGRHQWCCDKVGSSALPVCCSDWFFLVTYL